jgi:hypothetical protein
MRTLQPEYISDAELTDPTYGFSHPVTAIIWVDGHLFETSEPADWQRCLRLAARGVSLANAPGTAPAAAWIEAARRFARMVTCSCGRQRLDPAGEGFDCLLCDHCYQRAGWQNAHSDRGHDAANRDPDCPICQEEAVDDTIGGTL